MKLSVKLQDDQNPLLKAKVPISIFSQPFISSLTTTTPIATAHGSNKSSQNTSFSVSTNFPSGPSLKLSYFPSTSPTTTTIPFSLSLKSGLGLFGSPKDSPLVFSAQFSLSSSNPGTVIPTFSLHLKPQFGNFSLHKATLSNPSLEPDSGSHSVSGIQLQPGSPSNSEFETPVGSSVWQEVKLEPRNDGLGSSKLGYGKGLYSNDGFGPFGTESSLVRTNDKKSNIFGGIAVRARTSFPVTKRAVVNIRWAVNSPSGVGFKMPHLTVNKIGIERVEEVQEVKKKKNVESNEEDMELLKGMYFWMKRDLEILENENREMKQCLEDMRHGISVRKVNVRRESESIGRRISNSTPSVESSNEFERWRSKKAASGEDNGGKEVKKSGNANKMSDVESELQKAIKAASSS
ncbi:hypothetical protein CCACVL1_15161 [Corchorus capsularis]|uniref:Uncharacterized protein n=1 Tax=Corchorus capsularis TaxID=210143 RepID=A0A1R3I3L9_COCAP|nr:hypothetical protein CCACVL1_15161 [Corchorus capsularis]